MDNQIAKLNELDNSFRRCFGTKDGKVVLEYLEDTYHMRETTFRNGLEAIAFSEGQRTVILDIKDKMERKPQEEEE